MNEVVNIKELNAHIQEESVFVDTLRKEISRVIVGQQHLIDTLLINRTFFAKFRQGSGYDIGDVHNGTFLNLFKELAVPSLCKHHSITLLSKVGNFDTRRARYFERHAFLARLRTVTLLGRLRPT